MTRLDQDRAPARSTSDVRARPTSNLSLGDPAVEALAQRVADLVVERLAALDPRDDAPATADVRLVDAAELAQMLGRSRAWVYRRARAGKLAAIREGDGARPRLLFDPVAVLGSLGSREASERAFGSDRAGSAAFAGDRGPSARSPRRPRRGAGATTTRAGAPLLPIGPDREVTP